jgi:hypothetical protein
LAISYWLLAVDINKSPFTNHYCLTPLFKYDAKIQKGYGAEEKIINHFVM